MKQAVAAYHDVSVSREFYEAERMRDLARHNEASALANARRKERAKWEGVVAEQAAALAEQAAIIAELKALIANVEKAGTR